MDEQPESARPAVSRAENAGTARLVALAVAAIAFFPMLAKSGIWDPFELDAADLARRVALNLFGAKSLSLPHAPSVMPTLTDLKMGELPFTSMALGFRLFGLHDWAGRLPLAIWAFAGALAVFEVVARLVHPRAGVYAVIALATMPLYFMQARTMLGDVVTMAAFAMAFSGLAGAAFDETRPAGVGAWSALAVVGLTAGFLSRGAILGIAVPCASIGLAWLVLVLAGQRPRGLRPSFVGALALTLAAVAVAAGLLALQRAPEAGYLLRVLGVPVLKRPPVEATFDLAIRQLGHGLFPWSAFLPFAIGRLFRAPIEAAPERRARETALRVSVLVAAGCAYAGFALLAPYSGNIAFSGVAAFAVIGALAIFDFERGAPPSRVLALGTLVLGIVLYRDISVDPDRALACFVVDKPGFPKSFETQALAAMRVALVAFAGLVALSWFESDDPEPGATGGYFERRVAAAKSALLEIADVWQGNLVFALVVVEAALVGLGAMIFVGKRIAWSPVERLGKNAVDVGLNVWWLLPLAVAFVPIALVAVRDGFRALVAWTHAPRAIGAIGAAVLAGSVLGFWYYPALAAQLSPKEAFDAYAKLGPGEPLGMLGVRGRAAAYYSGGEVEAFSDANKAFTWLTSSMAKRRWLVIKSDDLPKMNALFRKLAHTNLPVLDGRSSQILLVSNQLLDHKNETPLASVVLDAEPQVTHPVHATFEDQLETVGWDAVDSSGNVVDSVVPQRQYKLRFVYRVRKPVVGSWKTFVHVDGHQRRFNGDHAPCDGRYPTVQWQPGDIIVDEIPVQLEPNFEPGTYGIFYGFFAGETRYKVSQGPQLEGRVAGGPIVVR